MNKLVPRGLLVVEDSDGDYELLIEYIKRSRLPVRQILRAQNMSEATGLASGNDFDVVLLDLSLPDSTGIDSVITMDRLLPKTPIVVLSGISAIEIAIESISLGAQDYLVKGEFDEKLLAKCLQYSIERKKTLEKLQESNERYELVNKATNDTIWDWNFQTQTGQWGEGLTEQFGYSSKGLAYDLDWLLKSIHPDDVQRITKSISVRLEHHTEKWTEEYRLLAADGTYRDVFSRGYILYDVNGHPYRLYGATMDITEKKRLEKELSSKRLEEQKLITDITIRAQEKERNELGKELHDNINQILATAKMYLGLKRSNSSEPDELIERSYESVNFAIEEIRKLSKSLVAPSLQKMDIGKAIEELVGNVNLTQVLQIEFINGIEQLPHLDKNRELMIYRVVQEQVNNILKHANAKKAVIILKPAAGNLCLSIADDGIGFDTEKAMAGIGLSNISSRVEFYTGNLNIISSPGKGCMLEITIPFGNEEITQ
jgi:two-component system sensor histidine kinase UhpB